MYTTFTRFISTVSGLCIAASLRIPRELQHDTFLRIIQDLTKQTHARARAVVMFVNEDNIRRLLAATIQHKVIITCLTVCKPLTHVANHQLSVISSLHAAH